MNLQNLITTIFEYKYFNIIIITTSLILITLFFIVLIVGLKDAKKKTKQRTKIIKEFEDITFKEEPEELIINEEITLEMPSITKNLEEFKKAIEEEIKQEKIESQINVEHSEEKSLMENTKPVKILNINEIEDTVIINTNEVQQEYQTIREKIQEEPIKITEDIKEFEVKEEAIFKMESLDIPLLAPDEDDEILFKTMTALQLPQDI